MNSQARIETHQALQALEDLDDCARMDVGISATGPYDLLRRYIQQQDRLALSHAAGQDGEQCRAASVEDSAVNVVLTTIRRERDAWLSWNHDHPEQAAITTPDVLEMAANLIRALSRGVPEAEPFVSCTCHEERLKQLCLNKHRCVRAYPLAAIAAQR